ncbi:hypothetical protein JNUCC64_30675 [Streptomyces sp. JNUCC 64]
MADLIDRFLLDRSEPESLAAFLTRATTTADGAGALTAVLRSAYDLTGLRVEAVRGISVRGVTLAHPLFPPRRHTGTATGTTPAYTRTDLEWTSRSETGAVWVDLLADTVVEVTADADPGGVESAVTREIEGFRTLEEFRDRFRHLDLDDFLARHDVSSVEELRAAARYLLTEVRFARPPVSDPADPARIHALPLTLAVLVRDDPGPSGALRAAKAVRALAGEAVAVPSAPAPAPRTAPYGLAVVLPPPDPAGGGPAPEAVRRLLAREGVLCLFADPG